MFVSRTKNLLVGNSQSVGVLFNILVVSNLQEHRFEIYSLALEIHDIVDMVIGIRNVNEIEGIISTRETCLHILNRSIPFFPKTELPPRHREQSFIKLM